MENKLIKELQDYEILSTPDLVINIPEFIKNKEREMKLLNERKKMEEDDLKIANDLFNGNHKKNENTFIPINNYKKKNKMQ